MKKLVVIIFVLLTMQLFGDEFQVIEDVLENAMSIKLVRMENKEKNSLTANCSASFSCFSWLNYFL